MSEIDKANEELLAAIQRVAEAGRDVADGAERLGTRWLVQTDDMEVLRHAIKGWTDASNAFLGAAQRAGGGHAQALRRATCAPSTRAAPDADLSALAARLRALAFNLGEASDAEIGELVGRVYDAAGALESSRGAG